MESGANDDDCTVEHQFRAVSAKAFDCFPPGPMAQAITFRTFGAEILEHDPNANIFFLGPTRGSSGFHFVRSPPNRPSLVQVAHRA